MTPIEIIDELIEKYYGDGKVGNCDQRAIDILEEAKERIEKAS